MALLGLTDIPEISRTVVAARIPQKWIPVLRSEYAQAIKTKADHITAIRAAHRSFMP
jgi:hypothetical protein